MYRRVGLDRRQPVQRLLAFIAGIDAQNSTDKDADTMGTTRVKNGKGEAEGEWQPPLKPAQRQAAKKATERLRISDDSDSEGAPRRPEKRKSSSGPSRKTPSQPSQPSKMRDVPVDAPPLSSSDEDEDDRRHGDIQTPNFTSAAAGGSPTSAGPSQNTGKGSQSKRPAKSEEPDDVVTDEPSSKKTKTEAKPSWRPPPGRPVVRTSYKNHGYGTMEKAKKEREERKKQRDAERKDNSQTPDALRFKAPVDGDSQSETVGSPEGKLKLPATTKATPQKSSPAAPTFNRRAGSRRGPAKKASPKRAFKPPESTRDRSDEMSLEQSSSPQKDFKKPKGTKTCPEQALSPMKPFKTPPPLSSSFSSHSRKENPSPPRVSDVEPVDRLDSSSPLTDVDSDTFLEVPDNVCPLCSAPVDADMLADFVKEHREMRFNDKQKFCRSHKLRRARDDWKDRGYPDIDWQKLEWRIQKQSGFLRAIVEGGESFYGQELSKLVDSGQAKTVNQVVKAGQSITPGYYGLRGLSIMSDHIVRLFNSLLRERAVADKLVSARGYATFVQSVLVPELTVKLIMEDMSVDQEKARTIMQESMSLGEMLNGEVVDTGKNNHDDDDESSSLSDLSN